LSLSKVPEAIRLLVDGHYRRRCAEAPSCRLQVVLDNRSQPLPVHAGSGWVGP
jgi:hypothetical protein